MQARAKRLSRTVYLIANSLFFALFVLVASSIPQLLKKTEKLRKLIRLLPTANQAIMDKAAITGKVVIMGRVVIMDKAAIMGKVLTMQKEVTLLVTRGAYLINGTLAVGVGATVTVMAMAVVTLGTAGTVTAPNFIFIVSNLNYS